MCPMNVNTEHFMYVQVTVNVINRLLVPSTYDTLQSFMSLEKAQIS
jgi:hypothetical protein